ncbi:MAG: sugar phosphate isomerase/epimerase [Clostridia bacterium]|nr:sugar phosphate isomerase/epimerase [Clostridia bacterium]
MTSRKNWEMGLSSAILGYYDGNNEKGFARYKKAGIKYAEISMSHESLEKCDFYENPEKLLEVARTNDVELWSFHVPFSQYFNVASLDEEKGSTAMAIMEKGIRSAIKIGIKTIVIHPSSEPNDDDTRQEKMERSIENLRYFAKICDENGAKLAVEVLPRTCLGNSSFDIITYLNEIPEIDLCFDTNHLLMQTNEDFLDDLIYHNMHGRIRTVHISDYDFIDERHRLPGDGINDWEAIISALEELDYSGVFMYEVSKPVDRELLTFEEIKENYICFMK